MPFYFGLSVFVTVQKAEVLGIYFLYKKNIKVRTKSEEIDGTLIQETLFKLAKQNGISTVVLITLELCQKMKKAKAVSNPRHKAVLSGMS